MGKKENEAIGSETTGMTWIRMAQMRSRNGLISFKAIWKFVFPQFLELSSSLNNKDVFFYSYAVCLDLREFAF